MIQTSMASEPNPVATASLKKQASVSLGSLRRSMSRVYASAHQSRIFFQQFLNEAPPVPKTILDARIHRQVPILSTTTHPGDGKHERSYRRARQNMVSRDRQAGNFYSSAADSGGRHLGGRTGRIDAQAESTNPWRRLDGNLGMFGKPRKFLGVAPGQPMQPALGEPKTRVFFGFSRFPGGLTAPLPR